MKQPTKAEDVLLNINKLNACDSTSRKVFYKRLKKGLLILKTLLLIVLVLLVCTCILIFPKSSADGVKKGLIFSSEILIPSLFPFIVLSSFVVKSSIASKIGRRLESITKTLFNLPGCTATTILLGLVGGYPTGARGIKALLDRKDITLKQGERMLCFVVGAGPAFVISVVGAGLMGSSIAGVILFVSQVTAAVLIGVISGLIDKDNSCPIEKRTTQNNVIDVSSALVDACTDSTLGMIDMCAFVVLFSAILSLMNDCGVNQFFIKCLVGIGIKENIANSLLSMLLEVTGGCCNAVKFGVSPELVSFAIGWAGICVHFQIISSLKDVPFSKLKFTLFRFLHGALAAIISHIGFLFFPQTKSVINTVSQKFETGFSSCTQGSIALVFLCTCFLASISSSEKNID